MSEGSTSGILGPSKPPPLKLVAKPPSRRGMKGRGSFMRDRFSVEYLKDFNATRAAIRAGYSRKTAASQGERVLKCAAVEKTITEARTRSLKKAEISMDRWLKELVAIAFVDFGHFFDEHGALLPINQMPEENRRALTRFEFEELFDSDRDKMTHMGRSFRLSCSGRPAALAMLLEHSRMSENS